MTIAQYRKIAPVLEENGVPFIYYENGNGRSRSVVIKDEEQHTEFRLVRDVERYLSRRLGGAR